MGSSLGKLKFLVPLLQRCLHVYPEFFTINVIFGHLLHGDLQESPLPKYPTT